MCESLIVSITTRASPNPFAFIQRRRYHVKRQLTQQDIKQQRRDLEASNKRPLTGAGGLIFSGMFISLLRPCRRYLFKSRGTKLLPCGTPVWTGMESSSFNSYYHLELFLFIYVYITCSMFQLLIKHFLFKLFKYIFLNL